MIVPMLVSLLELLSGLCAAGAAIGCLYLLAAAVSVLRFSRCRAEHAAVPEPVTVLKPLRGAEPGLLHRLVTICRQNYDAQVQVICGVRDVADPAIGAVEFLAGRVPNVDLVVDAHQRGNNPKISNLINMLPWAHHDVLVIADSDIEVSSDYLRNVAAELQQPGVGAVSCLYYGIPTQGIWAELTALSINGHFLPNVTLALELGLAQPCFGTTIALRRSTLARIGGLDAFRDVLADDYAIGQAVRAAGYDVAIPAFALGHACYEQSARALFAQELRVARTIKSIERIGYYGLVFTHPFPLALLGIFSCGGDALLLAAVALACRGLLCQCVEHSFAVERQRYRLILFRELLSFGIYLWGLFGTSVNWRGATYHVDVEGRLIASPKEAEFSLRP